MSKDGAVTAPVGRCRLTVVTLGGTPRFLIHGDLDIARSMVRARSLHREPKKTLARAMLEAEACANQRHEYHSYRGRTEKVGVVMPARVVVVHDDPTFAQRLVSALRSAGHDPRSPIRSMHGTTCRCLGELSG
jgi:hypothetical protein